MSGERGRVRALVRALSETEMVDLLCELHEEIAAMRRERLRVAEAQLEAIRAFART